MNDLQTLRAALTPEGPDQDVIDRSRHRLQNRIHGGRPGRRRIGWLTVGVGLTAAAAVAISVLPADVPSPADHGSSGQTATGKDVLLAAATAAEKTPEGSGTYWHVRLSETSSPEPVFQSWIGLDGRMWVRNPPENNGQLIERETDHGSRSVLGSVPLTVEQLRELPTEPEALKSAIREAMRNSDIGTGLSPETLEKTAYHALFELVSALPVPPEVRAAGFRALATYPDVRSLGEVPGGQGLLLPEDHRLVIDPATGRVNETSIVFFDRGLMMFGQHSSFRITAEWTDTAPQ